MSEEMCPNCVTPWKCNGPHEPGVDAMTATIRVMGRMRGELDETQADEVARLKSFAERAHQSYRDYCVWLMERQGCSIREVSRATGLSTNTLQRWKREAQ